MKSLFGKNKKTLDSKNQVRRGSLIQNDRQHLLSASSDFFIREAYKSLRTNVLFSLAGEDDSKVMLVTSSQQSEGKSITALNLAISFAQTDRKVIVLDCDLRRPKLARLLQLSSPVGLSNVLMDFSLRQKAVIHSGISNLDVMPAGDIPPNPSELLSSPRMQRLLEELKKEYDLVILDTPPINMVIDAVVLAPMTDGVLFVIRSNMSERGSVVHAVEQMSYANAKILGFVLNGVELEYTNYGYSKRHYAKYKRYGYGKYGYGKYGYGKYGYGYGYFSRSRAQHEKDEQK